MAKPPRPTLTAPVTVTDVIAPDDRWNLAWGPHPLDAVDPAEDQGRCFLCHQPIAWRVVVQDGTGAHHVLGQDCAARSWPRLRGLVTLAVNRAELRAKAEAERLEALAPLAELLEARRVDLAAQPHPMAGKRGFKGLTLADYGTWWTANGKAQASDLRRALGKLQEALGIESARQAEIRIAQAARLQEDQAKALELATEIRMWIRELQDPDFQDLSRRFLVAAVAKLVEIPSAHRPQAAREALEAAGPVLQVANATPTREGAPVR